MTLLDFVPAMTKPHVNDISIGKDVWITNVDMSAAQFAAAVDIDPLLLPMADFWNRLETNCVVECCGIDAFDLWSAGIERAVMESGDQALHHKLEALRAVIVKAKADCFKSARLNQCFHRDTLLQLIEHIDGHIPS